LEFETITCKNDFDIYHLIINTSFSELIWAECVVLEIVAVNLELLHFISHVKCLRPTELGIKWAGVVLGNFIGQITALHHSLIARHLVRLVATITEKVFAETSAEYAALVNAIRFAPEGGGHLLTYIYLRTS
jgi:hypothetical protein